MNTSSASACITCLLLFHQDRPRYGRNPTRIFRNKVTIEYVGGMMSIRSVFRLSRSIFCSFEPQSDGVHLGYFVMYITISGYLHMFHTSTGWSSPPALTISLVRDVGSRAKLLRHMSSMLSHRSQTQWTPRS